VVAVSAGGYHSLALMSDGTVVGWGWNFFGQATVPSGLSNVAAVVAGYAHSLALKRDGTVIAWGDNSRGQTGVPPGLSNVVALAPGPMASHVLATQKQVVSLPALAATRSGDSVIISWPSPSTGWTLQQNAALNQTNWTTNSYPISDNGLTRSIAIPSPAGSLFFRLIELVTPQLPGGGAPATFYVATNGDDAWSGTLPSPNTNNSDGPFATFDRARAAVRPLSQTNPVSVQLRAGTYFLSATELFASADSGTSNAPITYANYPGEAPVISGGRLISGWAPSSTVGGAWQASVAGFAPFEQLWVNGQRRSLILCSCRRPCLQHFLCNCWGPIEQQRADWPGKAHRLPIPILHVGLAPRRGLRF
jgi:Regulator of chromosome condensation (RCC1) repeat